MDKFWNIKSPQWGYTRKIGDMTQEGSLLILATVTMLGL